MSYDYNGFVAQLANLCGTNPTQPNFVIELPAAIDYAEQRLFRDLDPLIMEVTDSTQACVVGARYARIPGTFIVINGVNIITPSPNVPALGKRNQCVRTSQDLLDFLYPDNSIVGVPIRFHVQNEGFGATFGVLVLGPWADQPYIIEYVGTQRPAPLSAANPNTFFSTDLPDLFLIAAMIHMSAYQKNWSAMGPDPQQSANFESQYLKLLKGADAEELRKRYAGSSAYPPAGFDAAPPAAGG
jgi:hypothetical protein